MHKIPKSHASYINSEFVCSLVSAMTGVNLKETDTPEKNMDIAQNCVVFFIDYIADFIERKYGIKDALRIRAIYETGDDLFLSFPDLKEKYVHAYNSFVAYLESQNRLNGVGEGKEKLVKIHEKT